jgi:hypothetical protein
MTNVLDIFHGEEKRILEEKVINAVESQKIRKHRRAAIVHSLRVALYRTRVPQAMCYYVAEYLRVGFKDPPKREHALNVVVNYRHPPPIGLDLNGGCEWSVFDRLTQFEDIGLHNVGREAVVKMVYTTIGGQVERRFVPGMRAHLGRMKVAELKKLCREKYARSSGTKAKLVRNLLYGSKAMRPTELY